MKKPAAQLVLLLLLVAIPGQALDPNRPITRYGIRGWRDELPQHSVHTILQTRDGYLWLGTYEGLVRFDGVRFTVFDKDKSGDLPGNTVTHLREDEAGRLWIGTSAGLVVLEQGRFTTYTFAIGSPHSYVNDTLLDRDGTVWIATATGLGRLQDGKITVDNDPQGPAGLSLRALKPAPGGLWMASNNGVFLLEDGAYSQFGTDQGLPFEVCSTMASDSEGTLWVGTSRGLVRWREGRFEPIEDLAGQSIRALYADSRGALWIGTETSGLYRLVKHRLSSLNTEQGLTRDYVRAITEDREGSLWVGTSGGLTQLRDTKFAVHTTADGLGDDYVRTVFEDRDGVLWVGTGSAGICRQRADRFDCLTTADGLIHDSMLAMTQSPDGALWIGTQAGLDRFDGRRFVSLDGLSDQRVRAVFSDKRNGNELWVGTENGLNRWYEGAFQVFTTAQGLAGNNVRAIHRDSAGRLWIGTFSGLSSYQQGEFTTYRTDDGLGGNQVFCFFEPSPAENPEGELWIGTNGGLTRLVDGRLTSFDTSHGLHDNRIFRILADDRGNLWMSSNHGLARVPMAGLRDLVEGRAQRVDSEVFDTSDGMLSNQCNGVSQPAGWRRTDGHLWFPTARGIVEIDPGNLRRNQQPPQVLIEEVVVDQEIVDTGRAPRASVFGPGQESFEIHYTALSFVSPDDVEFRYRLEGFDDTWIEAGTRRTAYYTNLEPGEYQFQVIACNDDGLWNRTGATYRFRLRATLWQRWWGGFLILFLAAVGGLTWAMFKLHTRNLTQRNLLLEAMVDERTAELGEKNSALAEKVRQLEISESNALLSERRALEANRTKSIFLSNMSHELRTPLNSIIGFSSILNQKLEHTIDRRSRKFLRNIHSSGQHLLGLISDILDLSKIEAGRMEISAKPCELGQVVEAVLRLLVGVCERREITTVVELADDFPTLVGDAGKLKQILFNLVSNAVKFSPVGSSVKLKAQLLTSDASPLQCSTVRIDVIDQGIGIAEEHHEKIFEEFHQIDGSASREHEGTGLGLALVRRLLWLQGGDIQFSSRLGQGSTFSVFLPLVVESTTTSEPEPSAFAAVHQEEPHGQAEGPLILVVEDDPPAFHEMATTLEAEGYRVLGARDGNEALRLLEKYDTSLITLDLVLPDLDGWEVLRELKSNRQTHEIPVIIVTKRENRELCLALGADDFFLKPVGRGLFMERVRHILATPTSRPGGRILVIDDDEAVHDLLRAQLEPAGFLVISAFDGRTGLEKVRECDPDLLILDLMMPGMSGFEVAATLHGDPETARLPIIVLSAREVTEEERAMLADMIEARITKGGDSHHRLTETISNLLSRG